MEEKRQNTIILKYSCDSQKRRNEEINESLYKLRLVISETGVTLFEELIKTLTFKHPPDPLNQNTQRMNVPVHLFF